MKRLLLAALLGCATSPLPALLPPLYESLNEYKTLINDSRLPEQLAAGEFIKEIKLDNAVFEIVTNQQTIHVKVVYDPMQRPGPAQFHLQYEN